MKSPHSPGEIALQAAQGVAEDGADATRKRHGGPDQKAYSRVVYKRQWKSGSIWDNMEYIYIYGIYSIYIQYNIIL